MLKNKSVCVSVACMMAFLQMPYNVLASNDISNSYIEEVSIHNITTGSGVSDLTIENITTATSISVVSAEGEIAESADGLIINQVFGGGGKSKTPIEKSFIELYNATDELISLDGLRIEYSSNRQDTKHAGTTWTEDGGLGYEYLELSDVVLEPKQSYLIVGESETTIDDTLTYILPEADQVWDGRYIDNKLYTLSIIDTDDNVIDTVSTGVDEDNLIDFSVQDEDSDNTFSKTDTIRRVLRKR